MTVYMGFERLNIYYFGGLDSFFYLCGLKSIICRMKKYNLINNLLGWACFVIAAVTYRLTMEPTASFWDCPEFISQGAKLEVGHPPGNPIFMLTARFFVTIFGNDISSAAVAVNSMSALLSAATILLLFWTITHFSRRLLFSDDEIADDRLPGWKVTLTMFAGLCGALAYTWSDTFWFSAVEGEVYAFSSFCTALVVWLMLKWENRADQPHSDRYLVLIAYVIGVSIAVHLLNLLCIPALGLIYYYRRTRNVSARGSLLALLASVVVVALILYGLVPGFVRVSQTFELFGVNTLGMGYNMGVLLYAVVLVGAGIWAVAACNAQRSASMMRVSMLVFLTLSGIFMLTHSWWLNTILWLAMAGLIMFRKVSGRLYNVIALSVLVIFIGYSSYALLLIRASANTPMNQNAPDNVFALASYLNREQYGDRPLFLGPTFAEEMVVEEYPQGSGNFFVIMDEYGRPKTRMIDGYLRDANGSPLNNPSTMYTKVVKTREDQPDEYVDEVSRPDYKTMPDLNMLMTRIYSSDPGHVQGYKGWAQYSTPDINSIPAEVRDRWAETGYAPLYEVMPYVTHQERVTTNVDFNGNSTKDTYVWKPGFDVNLRYFINYQLNHMYWRYFMWNFAGRQNDLQGNGESYLGNWISGIPLLDNARLGDQTYLPDEFGKGNKGHNVFYMLPLILGLIGLLWQSLSQRHAHPSRGIEQFWVVFFLFFMTGIAIVLYLNQTPGQPRERDYAFAGSFYAFAIWIGLGVPAIGMMLERALKGRGRMIATGIAAAVGIAVPLQMVSQTWDDHDRSGRYTARDFGFNYLSSVDPNGIIFTNGDNDTFPLWYAQEVEGYRTDVRVVNLSYLTTDWYAEQMRHATYDAAPVPMYAKTADTGYERMAWSFILPDGTPTEASQALHELYASNEKEYGAPYMSHPNIYIPVDRAKAMARYGSGNAATDSLLYLPFLGDITTDLRRLGSSGLNQSKVVSLDMIVNSIKGGWERPIYFATTVPTSYYLGLLDYMSTNGMAYEVTPFRTPEINPTVDKAFVNILTKYRWGGLDAENGKDIYLDETSRRMVSSLRSAAYTIVENLILSGDIPATEADRQAARDAGYPEPADRYDMARILLKVLQDKLPTENAPYDSMMGTYMAQSYFDLYNAQGRMEDLDAADALLDQEADRYAQMAKYATTLSPSDLRLLGRTEQYSIQFLSAVLGLKNRIALLRAEAAAGVNDPESPARLHSLELDLRVGPLLFIQGYDPETLESQIESFTGQEREVIAMAIALLRANEAAGIDPMAQSEALMKKHGLTPSEWYRVMN